VLVGHSYGAVITNAAAGVPTSRHWYIAAFVPDVGETLGALISKYPGTQIPDAVRECRSSTRTVPPASISTFAPTSSAVRRLTRRVETASILRLVH
jgi:hypothetical protein